MSMDLPEWFRRYSTKLIELCPPNSFDAFALGVWRDWGRIESIDLLFAAYLDTPEAAAVEVIRRQREGIDPQTASKRMM